MTDLSPTAFPSTALAHSPVFTRALRVRFLDHLASSGNVRAAAARVGVSRETAYRARRQDPALAELWDAALVHARHFAETELATRALDGVEVAVRYRGEVVGHEVRHDSRLLLAHLARLDRRVEDDTAAGLRAARFDELLATYAGHPAPEGFAEAAEDALDWRERADAPALPPTRRDYVIWHRSRVAGGRSGRAEAARMADAEEAGGALWDGWHAGAFQVVGAILDDGEGLAVDAPAPAPVPAPAGTPIEPQSGPQSVSAAPRAHPRKAALLNRVASVNTLAAAAPAADSPPRHFAAGPGPAAVCRHGHRAHDPHNPAAFR